MHGTLTGDSNTYTIALFSVRCSKVTLITWSKRSKVIFRAIMRAHAQVRHGSQQPMKLQDTIDIACSKKVTLSESSYKKAITNDAKFFTHPPTSPIDGPLMILNEMIGTLGINIANIGEHCNPANFMYTKYSIVYSVLFMLHVFVQFLTINRMVLGLKCSQMATFRPIDSDYFVNKRSRIVGTVQRHYHPLVQVNIGRDYHPLYHPSAMALLGDYDP